MSFLYDLSASSLRGFAGGLGDTAAYFMSDGSGTLTPVDQSGVSHPEWAFQSSAGYGTPGRVAQSALPESQGGVSATPGSSWSGPSARDVLNVTSGLATTATSIGTSVMSALNNQKLVDAQIKALKASGRPMGPIQPMVVSSGPGMGTAAVVAVAAVGVLAFLTMSKGSTKKNPVRRIRRFLGV